MTLIMSVEAGRTPSKPDLMRFLFDHKNSFKGSDNSNTGGCFTVLEVSRKSGVSPEFCLPCYISVIGITNADISIC